MRKRILIDLDGTLTLKPTYHHSRDMEPNCEVINTVNWLYDGDLCEIIIWTARRTSDRKIIEEWLKENGVKYHDIITDKPGAFFYVDDKTISPTIFTIFGDDNTYKRNIGEFMLRNLEKLKERK